MKSGRDRLREVAQKADQNARHLVFQGKTQEAVAEFRQAHELDPKTFNYSPVEEASRAAADRDLWRADDFLREVVSQAILKNPRLAEETFKQAKDKDPSLARVSYLSSGRFSTHLV